MDSAPHALSKPLAAALALAFVGASAGIGFYDAYQWWQHGPAPGGAQLPVPLDGAALLRGRTTHALDLDLQNGSAFALWARPRWNELRLAALGDAGRRVALGRDGWLFLATDLRPPHDTERLQREFAAHAAAALEALRARGVETQILIVPDKSTVERAGLPEALPPPPDSYARLLEFLPKGFAPAPELAAFMRARPDVRWYRKDDTHWTLDAVARVAEHVAPAVRALAGEAGPPVQWTLSYQPWPPSWAALPDLLYGIGLRAGSRAWNELRDAEAGALIELAPSAEPCEIFLAGTSMSFKQLRERLSVELGCTLGNYAQAGAGASGKLCAFMRDLAAGQLPKVRVLVWECVERYTREGPCLTFAELPAAVEQLYARDWRPLGKPACSSARPRELDTLAHVPLEGETLPRRTDTWLVRRLSGFSLPGDGSCALVIDAPFAVPARALLARELPSRGFSDAVVHELRAGATRIPLIAAGRIESLELALELEQGRAQPALSLETAWGERQPLLASGAAPLEAAARLEPAAGWTRAHELALELVLEAAESSGAPRVCLVPLDEALSPGAVAGELRAADYGLRGRLRSAALVRRPHATPAPPPAAQK